MPNIGKSTLWLAAAVVAVSVSVLGIEQNYRYGAWLDGQSATARRFDVLGFSITLGAGMTYAVLNAMKVLLPVMVTEVTSWRLKIIGGTIFSSLAVLSTWNTFSLTTLTRADRAAVETRQAQRFADVRSDYAAAMARLGSLGETRPAAQVDADLAAERQDRRWQSSKACTDATASESRSFCGAYSRLQGEAAAAAEAANLRIKAETLRVNMAKVDHVGAINPELATIQRMTGFDGETAGAVRALVFAIVFELAEAFALLLAWACRPNGTLSAKLEGRSTCSVRARLHKKEQDSCGTVPGDASYRLARQPSVDGEGRSASFSEGPEKPRSEPPTPALEGRCSTLQKVQGRCNDATASEPSSASIAQPSKDRPTGTLRVVGSNVAGYVDARLKNMPGTAVQAADLWSDYLAWCQDNHLEPVTQTRFGRELPGLGIAKAKAGGFMWYQNVALSA